MVLKNVCAGFQHTGRVALLHSGSYLQRADLVLNPKLIKETNPRVLTPSYWSLGLLL